MSILPRQTCGFEGFIPRGESAPEHRFPPTDGPDMEQAHVYPSAALTTNAGDSDRHDYVISSVDEFLRLDVVSLERIESIPHGLYEAFVAVVGVAGRESERVRRLHVGIENLQYPRDIAAHEGPVARLHQFHVLLRHRPHSISPCQEESA